MDFLPQITQMTRITDPLPFGFINFVEIARVIRYAHEIAHARQLE